MCKSAARALIEAMGRLSLTVMSVRLFPASDIVRRTLSSSSDHRSYCLRVNIVVASEASEAGPSFGMSKRTQLVFLSTAAGCQVEGQVFTLPPAQKIFPSRCFSIQLRKCNCAGAHFLLAIKAAHGQWLRTAPTVPNATQTTTCINTSPGTLRRNIFMVAYGIVVSRNDCMGLSDRHDFA
jgi:hypothetical protein